MTSTGHASGCGAEFCQPCGKTFTIFARLASAVRASTACSVDGSPASGSALADSAEQAAPHCKDPDTLALRSIHLCADGHNGDCSACGVGSGSELKTSTFCGPPPSCCLGSGRALPYSGRSELPEVRESRKLLDELKASRFLCWTIWAGSGLAGRLDHSAAVVMDGAVSAALPDSQTQLPGGSHFKGLFYCYGCGRGG